MTPELNCSWTALFRGKVGAAVQDLLCCTLERIRMCEQGLRGKDTHTRTLFIDVEIFQMSAHALQIRVYDNYTRWCEKFPNRACPGTDISELQGHIYESFVRGWENVPSVCSRNAYMSVLFVDVKHFHIIHTSFVHSSDLTIISLQSDKAIIRFPDYAIHQNLYPELLAVV